MKYFFRVDGGEWHEITDQRPEMEYPEVAFMVMRETSFLSYDSSTGKIDWKAEDSK